MYTIYADGECIYDDRLQDVSLKLISPKLDMQENSAGSLSFTMPQCNVKYASLQRLGSEIVVERDGKEIWSGRPISEKEDFWKNRAITCEGELAYLNDTTQPLHEYENISPRSYLGALLDLHNQKSDKKFEVGIVTVELENKTYVTNYDYTISYINSLVEETKGHLRIRKENGVRYLDLLKDYMNTNSQEIRFGRNLLDFVKSWDLTNLATVVLPRGKRLDESPIEDVDAYTTVESVNRGSVYVVSQEALNTYGWIEAVVDWNDVDEPATLLEKAKEYLADIQFDEMVLELTAVDLHYLSKDTESINLLDQVYCISLPHGMDRVFPVTKVSISIDSPENTKYTLGDSVKTTSLTSKNKQANDDILKKIDKIPTKQSVLKEAKDNATQLINSATNGYISLVRKDDYTEELVISDTKDYLRATRLWKWNINGLGYSNDGGKTYGLAITMDGQIVADYITTGTMSADRVRAGILTDLKGKNFLNLETGECSISSETKIDNGDTISYHFTNLDGKITSEITKVTQAVSNELDDMSNDLDDKLSDLSTNIETRFSSITQTAEEIQTEVGTIRDDLSGYDRRISTITQSMSRIELSVDGLSDNVSSFSSRLSVVEGKITSIVTKGDVTSMIEQSASSIRMKAATIQWSSTYSSLTADGKLTCQDAIIKGTIEVGGTNKRYGSINIYDSSNYNCGTIDQYGIDLKERSSTWPLFYAAYNHTGSREALLSSSGLEVNTISGGEVQKSVYVEANEIWMCPPSGGTSISLKANGNFSATGKKNRIIKTEDFGRVLQYCYETSTPMFGDSGMGEIDELGVCYIFFDPVFLETVATDCSYRVFLQKEGRGDIWVAEKRPDYFIVQGSAGLSFAWHVEVKQKGYEYERLEVFDNDQTEKELESDTDYVAEANLYLKEFEEEIYA